MRCFLLRIILPVGRCPMSHFEMNIRSVCEVWSLAFPKVFQSAAARVSMDISHLLAKYLTYCLCPMCSYMIFLYEPCTSLLSIYTAPNPKDDHFRPWL